MNIRGEGWKEFKDGTVLDVEQRLERDERNGELVERTHEVNMTYTAVPSPLTVLLPPYRHWRSRVIYQLAVRPGKRLRSKLGSIQAISNTAARSVIQPEDNKEL